MNSESAGLLKAIIAKPNDDQARLVYADWLEEQGDPRADFIRLQCQMAQHERWEADYDRLSNQSEAILATHQNEWTASLGVKTRAYFQRGFIDSLTLSAKALSEINVAALKATPPIRIRITHVRNNIHLLKKSGVMKWVRGLKLSGNLSPDQMMDILALASPQLHLLDFSGYESELPASLGKQIGAAPFAKRLTELYLRACEVNESFFEALAENGGLPKLNRFELGGGMSKAPPAHFDKLNLARVRQLKVGGKLNFSQVQQLGFLKLIKLKSLTLRGTRPPAKGIKFLIESGAFTSVERINLGTCNLSKASLNLIGQTRARHCTHLNLGTNPNVDNEFVEELVNGNCFPSLKALNVENTGVHDPDEGKFLESLPFFIRC